MFLIERLFGVGVFAALLAIVYLLIAQKDSHYKIILFVYNIGLALMGFFYVPHENADLYRINEAMHEFSKLSFEKFWNSGIDESATKAANIYYWLIGRTGILQLLPFITSLITYSCIFYIICNYAKKHDISRTNIAVTVLFVMSSGTYMYAIAGIRTMLSLSMICFCFYRESVEKKHSIWHLPIYAVACLLHNFAVAMMGIRLVVPLLSRYVSLLKKITHIILMVIVAFIGYPYIIPLVQASLDRAESYLSYEHYSYVWGYVIAILTVFVVVVILAYFLDNNKQTKEELSMPRIYIVVCMIFAIVFCYEYSIFHRTITYLIPILTIPILMSQLQFEDSRRKINVFRVCILVLSCVIMFVACARGSLSSLKFFEL